MRSDYDPDYIDPPQPDPRAVAADYAETIRRIIGQLEEVEMLAYDSKIPRSIIIDAEEALRSAYELHQKLLGYADSSYSLGEFV